MTEMMRGTTAVRRDVAAYLFATVPTLLAQARTAFGLNDLTLPDPVGYDAYEPFQVDRWPLIGLHVSSAGNFRLSDIEPDASQTYLVTYNVQVFVWVRTPTDTTGTPFEPEYDESIRLRDDMAAIVRHAILRSGHFGQNGRILVNHLSLSEEYSEPAAVKGDRVIAAGMLSFTLDYDESVPFVPLGTADTLVVLTDVLPYAEAGS